MSTIKQYIADGTTALYQIPFPYLDQNHVGVSLNGFPMNLGAHFEYVPGGGAIQFRPHVTPVQNVLVEIKRETPIRELLVKFQNGATLTQEDLNTASLQSLYSIEELWDRYEARFGEAAQRLSNGQFTNAQNLIDAAVASVLESQLLADLQARVSDIDLNAESILEQTNRVNVLQTTVDGYLDDFEDIDARIISEQSARVEGDTAIATDLSLIGAKSGDNLSFILNLSTVKVDGTTSLGSRLSGIDTRVGSAESAILTEQTTRASADSALTTQINQVSARVDTNAADIVSEQTTRASADSAMASNIALLGARNAAGSAFILNTATAFVDATTSLATRLSGIESKADRVRTFRQTSAPTSPQTGDIWVDTDSSPANLAYRWSGTAWQSIDNADIAANKAAIVSEQTTRANADSALASDITTLQTTVNGNTSSISTMQTVQNGLTAQYMVKLDVNGYVSGFGLYNAAGSSQFTVLADKFAVVTPGQTPKVPFVITGGVVYMQNVVIKDALIENLQVGKLTSGILTASITQNADINVGTGRIIWSNGTYMKVAGIGFGSGGDLIEWFGPAMSVSSCSRANATYFLATNGDAYFGGALRAGTLYNAIQTSDIGGSAQVTLGPYGTNGNPKTIVLSYSASRNGNVGTEPAIVTPSATVQLYRTIAGGVETLVGTLNVSGSMSKTQGGVGEGWDYSWGMSGSLTISDTASPTTNDRTYRAVIAARSSYNAPATQRIGITSQE